jgi:rubrerythrin
MVFGFLKKKKPESEEIVLPPPEPVPTKPEATESATIEAVKAKIDLIATHIDGLKAQYALLNERLENLEKMVKEIYQMAKS